MAEQSRFNLRPVRPYSLERTLARFQRFPEVVDLVEDGTYRRLLPVGRRLLLVSVRQLGPPSRALLEVRLRGKDAAARDARNAATRLAERALGARAAIPDWLMLPEWSNTSEMSTGTVHCGSSSPFAETFDGEPPLKATTNIVQMKASSASPPKSQ